ncbi:MarR family winged helix-turn-helix transcriptional regulator [Paenibacillus sp. NPDC056579]|uniref:MarR family winged helix-turn-helix transcriptional regulator n=1 Tax=Paenibacillus sp. NPDC056579 TaxID=3345871 RepID=UPI0036CCEF6D
MVVLSKAYKSVMDKAVKDIKQYDLSPSEFGILEVLYTKGSIPLQQIGDKILITSGTMTYNIDKLEKKQLLRRIPGQEDRRMVYAELTDKGKEFIQHIMPRHAAHIHSMMQSLSDHQKNEAIALLKLLGKGVDEA